MSYQISFTHPFLAFTIHTASLLKEVSVGLNYWHVLRTVPREVLGRSIDRRASHLISSLSAAGPFIESPH